MMEVETPPLPPPPPPLAVFVGGRLKTVKDGGEEGVAEAVAVPVCCRLLCC